jgi:hypothetical protein
MRRGKKVEFEIGGKPHAWLLAQAEEAGDSGFSQVLTGLEYVRQAEDLLADARKHFSEAAADHFGSSFNGSQNGFVCNHQDHQPLSKQSSPILSPEVCSAAPQDVVALPHLSTVEAPEAPLPH